MQKEQNIMTDLSVFDLKPATKRVFVCLVEKGASPASDIAKYLNMPKSSVYDSLNELIDKSLAVETSNDKSRVFEPAGSEQITRIHKERIKALEISQVNLLSFINNSLPSKNVARPRIKFYSGAEGIAQAFRDMSWTKDHKEAYLMWPTTDMINLLGADFLYEHRQPGIKLGVTVNVIEQEKDRKLSKSDLGWIKNGEANLAKKRYAPKDTEWNMSYWLYGDKCLFAGSGSEKFAFIIHSNEFANLMHVLWKQMWNVSKE